MQTPLAENAPVVNKRPLDLALDEVAAHVAPRFRGDSKRMGKDTPGATLEANQDCPSPHE